MLKEETILIGTKVELLDYFESLLLRTLLYNVGEVSDNPISFNQQLDKMEESCKQHPLHVGLVFYSVVKSKDDTEGTFPKVNIEFVAQYIRIVDDETKH